MRATVYSPPQTPPQATLLPRPSAVPATPAAAAPLAACLLLQIKEKERLRAAGIDGFDAPAAAEAGAVPDVAEAVAEAVAVADAVAGAAVAAPQNESLRKVETGPRCDCKWASSSTCTAPSDDGSRCWSQCCSLLKASVLNRLKDVWKES